MLPWPVLAVGKKEVLPAIAVVVDEGDAGSESFRQILFSEGAGVVRESQPGRFRHIHKLDVRSGALQSRKCGYGEDQHREHCCDANHRDFTGANAAETCSWIVCRSLLSSG